VTTVPIDRAEAIRRFRQFPEVEQRWAEYASDVSTENEPQLYDFFAQVVYPYLLRPVLDAEAPDPESMRRIFALAEELATDGDDAVKVFVRIEICETVLAKDNRTTGAFPYIGPQTAALCRTTSP
jgi:hypothetical protein